MTHTYPLVVYGPQGAPRDVCSADEEAILAAQGYARHWHMGGTYGRPVPVEPPVAVVGPSSPPVEATPGRRRPGRPKRAPVTAQE